MAKGKSIYKDLFDNHSPRKKTTYLFFERVSSQASLILFPFHFSGRKNDGLKGASWRKKGKKCAKEVRKFIINPL